MRKHFELYKTLQLFLFLAIAGTGLAVILTDSSLYQLVGRDPSIRILCILLWAALLASFIFIFIDFRSHSSFKREYRELDYAVYNDAVAGIANRFSCDAVIEKYFDKPLPDTVGCVMLDIANIGEINRNYGRSQGNAAIQSFSDLLNAASVGLCFVGRNGGNKFMALFEDCTDDKLNTFMTRLDQKVEAYNCRSDVPKISFRSGKAFREGAQVTSITQLIALADRRIVSQTDMVAGIAGRCSCDDIINAYLDKPLPPDIGCIMLDITNLREVNDRQGHLEGNRLLRAFSDILRESSVGLCFAGRNGGTKFMALFEQCEQSRMDDFLARVKEKTAAFNEHDGQSRIEYSWGLAFREGPEVNNINRLIALADRRIHDNT